MARVRFLEPYRYTPSAERRVCIKYPASPKPRLVKRECAEAAIAAGAAELVEPGS